MTFQFATAERIIFGCDQSVEIPSMAQSLGTRIFVLTGKSQLAASPILETLRGKKLIISDYPLSGEPTTESVIGAAQAAKDFNAEVVISIGGGSVVDTGKAVSALLTNRGELTRYLEVIGEGRSIENPPVAHIAVPTTSGTGAEVTKNSVIKSEQHHVKVSMRSPMMLPKIAVVDPMLTLTVPPDVTAATGLDALTQLIESFVSHKANPLTDGLCKEGISRAARALSKAYRNGSDIGAREDMSIASLFGGLALANAKLGAVHGFAGPLGGMIPAPHGVICARILPHAMKENIKALKSREPESPSLARFDQVGKMLTDDPSADASDSVQWLSNLCKSLHMPHLADFGFTQQQIPELVEKAQNTSSMKGNPILLTEDELSAIVESTFS